MEVFTLTFIRIWCGVYLRWSKRKTHKYIIWEWQCNKLPLNTLSLSFSVWIKRRASQKRKSIKWQPTHRKYELSARKHSVTAVVSLVVSLLSTSATIQCFEYSIMVSISMFDILFLSLCFTRLDTKRGYPLFMRRTHPHFTWNFGNTFCRIFMLTLFYARCQPVTQKMFPVQKSIRIQLVLSRNRICILDFRILFNKQQVDTKEHPHFKSHYSDIKWTVAITTKTNTAIMEIGCHLLNIWVVHLDIVWEFIVAT